MSGVSIWAEEEGEMTPEETRSSPQWSEECCEEMWDRVEGVRHKLTRILNPAKITPYLRQCKVIDEQDEDEVLNSPQYPLRISKAGRLLDILRGQGPRGLQAFMESLEFYHPEQFTQLTGQQATQRCSLILDEEGPEGLTQFLLLEVRKLREQVRNSRMCERRLSQRCRMAEEERSRAEGKVQELRHDRLQLERLRHDWESASRELVKLKDRHLEQAVKYSRTLEEQAKCTSRERELLKQVEELRSRLTQADNPSPDVAESTQSVCLLPHGGQSSPPPPDHQENLLIPSEVPQEESKEPLTTNPPPTTGVIALMDILQQDRREAAEQRQELCNIISRLQGELQSTEENKDMLDVQCEHLQLKVRTLQLDWEMEQKRSVSYFNQIMELEKERDQALRSRDSLQLEYTDCLLDKNRLRKRIAELQANLEQQQRELEREKERRSEQMEQSSPCLHCSHLSLCSEEQCFGPCCSDDLDLSPQHSSIIRRTPARGHANENSEDYCFNSEENLLFTTENDEKEINRLSIFTFPPCMNSINRRFNTEFDSGGSDENDNFPGEQSEPSLWDSWTSLHSHLFPPDLVNIPVVSSQQQNPSVLRNSPQSPSSSPTTPPKRGRVNLADDVMIVGGNHTGIFVSYVKSGSAAEKCGLKEGSELLELEHVLFGGGSVQLSQCTAEVAHFSLQWWTEPSALKHQSNPEAYSKLHSQLSSPSFPGADSFYVRVNLNMEPHGDTPSMAVSCDDILHVTDTRHNGKYHWKCSLVDPETAKPVKSGAMPNYNRAQQLLLVHLRQMSLEQKDFRKRIFLKKAPPRVRLVKAARPSGRGVGSTQQVFYTLSKRHEEQLIPYSLVHPVQVQTKRPIIFSPCILSHSLIERMLQPAESALMFDSCSPEPIPPSERQDKKIFLLNSSSSEQTVGIRLQSIQDVISQNKHCLLELGLSCVEGLLRQGIYPIVIHVRPKNKKHQKLRKLFPRCKEDTVMEKVCQEAELQLETLPLLYCSVEPNTWSCTNELLAALQRTIHSQQRAVAWVELDRLQ